MPQQPNLFSSSAEGRSALTQSNGTGPVHSSNGSLPNGPPVDAPARRKPSRTGGQRFGRALMATEFLLAIMVRIFIGVIVFVLPWSPLWDNNHLLQEYPRIAHFFSYGATRGVFSGIGLLNLWIAVDETLHRNQRHI
jgi:hypothetical protein